MDLTSVDPILAARLYLLQTDAVTDIFGDRVGTADEPPYPRLRLSDPPGDDRDMNYLLAPLLQVEVLGDYDGTPLRPVLRHALYTVIGALRDWPRLQAIGQAPHGDGHPTISGVRSSSGGGWAPEPAAAGLRPRYMSTLRIYMHP